MRAERDAKLLGYAGLIPFAGGALLAWVPGVPVAFLSGYLGWTLYYGAIILSFMGGARWGLAMIEAERGARPGEPFSGLLAAVTPALIGWVAIVPPALLPLAFPTSARLILLSAGFAGLLAEDLRAQRQARAAPRWYAALRVRLTFWVLLALAFLVVRLLAG